MKTLLLSAALLAGLAISAGDVGAQNVRTHEGTQPIQPSDVAYRPESQVQGYIGHGMKVVGHDELGRPLTRVCMPPVC